MELQYTVHQFSSTDTCFLRKAKPFTTAEVVFVKKIRKMCRWPAALYEIRIPRGGDAYGYAEGSSYHYNMIWVNHLHTHTVYLTFRGIRVIPEQQHWRSGEYNIIWTVPGTHAGRTTMRRRTRRRYWFQNDYARVAEQQPGWRRALLSHAIVKSREPTRTCHHQPPLQYNI